MFQMTQVTKAYRTDLLETHALREFSLQVEKGEFVAVTGPSGSGKTTFLNVAGLLESFDSGTLPPRRRGREQARRRRALARAQPQDRLHLPELQPDPGPQRVRQRRRAAALSAHAGRRAARAHQLGARPGGPVVAREAPAVAALGRAAAARRDRARARRRPGPAARRRADRQPRLADGAPGHGPARADQRHGHDDRHGHARPGAGAPRASQRAGHRRPDHGLQAVRIALGVGHGAAPAAADATYG